MPLAVSPILPVTPSGKSGGKLTGKGHKKSIEARERPDGDSVPRMKSVAKMAGRVEIVDTSTLKSKQKPAKLALTTVQSNTGPIQQKSLKMSNKDQLKKGSTPAKKRKLNESLDETFYSTTSKWTDNETDMSMNVDASPIVVVAKKNKRRKVDLSEAPATELADTVNKKKGEAKLKSDAGSRRPEVKGKKMKLLDKQPKTGDKSGSTATEKKVTQGKKDGTDGKKVKDEELSFKERKEKRRKQSKNYDCAKMAVKLWEKLRIFDQAAEDRKKIYMELFKIVKGRTATLINAHDTARVIQSLIKFSTPEQRNVIFDELKTHILAMTKSVYAKFIVRKFLKYGTKGHRDYVFNALCGHIRKLVRHKEAADTVEYAYDTFANATQRMAMVQEFYGPMFAVYKSEENKTLASVLSAHPEKSESILTSMKETLSVLVEKNALQYTFVHKLFLDFFMYANEKLRSEMIESVREGLIHMIHTREGARVGMLCLWHGTAKDRKAIVKSFKTYVEKISSEEYGHLVMLALFDVVDDTKLVQKAILDELLKATSELAVSSYGRKVLLYLLAPRDPLHFHPDIIAILSQGDGNLHSKKEAQVRRQELLACVSRALVQWVAQHAQQHVLDNAVLLLIVSVVQHVKCDPTEAMSAIARLAARPFSAEDSHLVEHPAGHLALKRLILNDAERLNNNEIILFSNILLDLLPPGSLESWTTCNRGCFIVISLLEVKNKAISDRVKNLLKPTHAKLGLRQFKGAQILLQKLTE